MEKLKLRKEHETIFGMEKSYLDPTHDFQANANRLLVPGQQHEAHDRSTYGFHRFRKSL